MGDAKALINPSAALDIAAAKKVKKGLIPEIPLPDPAAAAAGLEAPTREDPEVQAVALKERRLNRQRRGRRSTILTNLRQQTGQPLG